MKEALFYEKLEIGSVRCNLCPQFCIINKGKRGNCHVRYNYDEKLYSENFGSLTALNTDPIEKKPLYHFYPGSSIFSIGSAGCNLHCRFCQNFEISQSSVQELMPKQFRTNDIVETAKRKRGNIGIAYTYNEPTVFFEFMFETAQLASNNGLKNVMVSNGFINPAPLELLIGFMDAFNIDLKSFSDKFYHDVVGGKLLPILENLKFIRKKMKHLEVTHLLVPGLNDSISEFSEMIKWISCELGQETVLHISRYFPRYRYSSPPTSEEKLIEFYNSAKEKLSFVYLGNIAGSTGHDTICPACSEIVIKRQGYYTDISGLDGKGNCISCGKSIAVQ
jgi:pyruvate formate lyase activating enzyme